MNKFKVGDEIVGTGDRYIITGRGWRGRVTQISGNQIEVLGTSYQGWVEQDYFDLVKTSNNKDKDMGRRTFRLLKELPELKKGAIVQEKCDDGDQDYTVLDENFIKYEDEDGDKMAEFPREAVEKEPKFFVEVFPAIEAWATKEEKKAFKEFQRAQKKNK